MKEWGNMNERKDVREILRKKKKRKDRVTNIKDRIDRY